MSQPLVSGLRRAATRPDASAHLDEDGEPAAAAPEHEPGDSDNDAGVGDNEQGAAVEPPTLAMRRTDLLRQLQALEAEAASVAEQVVAAEAPESAMKDVRARRRVLEDELADVAVLEQAADAREARTRAGSYVRAVDALEGQFAAAVADAVAVNRLLAELATMLVRLRQALDPGPLRPVATQAGGQSLVAQLFGGLAHGRALEDAVAGRLRDLQVLTGRSLDAVVVGRSGGAHSVEVWASACTTHFVTTARRLGPRAARVLLVERGTEQPDGD